MYSVRNLPLVVGLACPVLLSSMNFAQGSPPAAGQHAPATQPAAPAPEVIFHTATRLVTIEVVARDHDRHPLTDLTKDDFHVFEQIAGKKEKNEQKIAVFRRSRSHNPRHHMTTRFGCLQECSPTY